jgi:hypothetical protein
MFKQLLLLFSRNNKLILQTKIITNQFVNKMKIEFLVWSYSDIIEKQTSQLRNYLSG